MKNTILALTSCCLLAALILWGCKKDEDLQPNNSIREAVEYALTPGADLTKEVELEGYYWNDGAPILIVDLSLLNINTALPQTAYVRLTDNVLKVIGSKTEYLGALVRFKGTLELLVGPDKGFQIFLRCPDLLPFIIQARKVDVQLPFLGTICDRFPAICSFTFTPLPGKYALLYSGGVRSDIAHRRYWNDLRFMYAVLREKYGYSDENIVVVYKDGVGQDANMPVDFAATPNGLNAAIDFLRARTTDKDDLFLFVTNHGGGLHRWFGHQGFPNPRFNVARQTGVPDDNLDEGEPENTDEVVFFFDTDPITLSDDAFAEEFNSIPHRRLVAVLEPCFSGGFIQDLSSPNAVIMSACLEDEFSYGGFSIDGVGFDNFSYFFTAAINRAHVNGQALSTNPDTDNNGRVSMLEAYNFARANALAFAQNNGIDETSLLDADGDGVGRNNPTFSDSDGDPARYIFL
ncbi:MAG: hypothetical protein ACKVU2_08100 [Saprospiraceae bacterium]